MKCTLCGKPIDGAEEVWVEVSGWVKSSSRDSMKLRSDTGNSAHAHCLDALSSKQDPASPDLFEAAETPKAEKNTAAMETIEGMDL